jgi:hypothetical protein
MVSRILRFISIYLIVALFAVVALLVDTWPQYPRSPFQWLLLLIIAYPVTILGDWLSEHALSDSLALVIATRTRSARVSWLRITYYLALYVLFGICTLAILYWVQSPAI